MHDVAREMTSGGVVFGTANCSHMSLNISRELLMQYMYLQIPPWAPKTRHTGIALARVLSRCDSECVLGVLWWKLNMGRFICFHAQPKDTHDKMRFQCWDGGLHAVFLMTCFHCC